jgi:hypothetical protein
MAAPINVPTSQRAAIHELAALSDDAYRALGRCLAEGKIYSEPSALIEQTSKAVATHTRLGGQILGAVIGLRTVVDRASLSASDVAAGVVADSRTKNYVPPELGEVLSQRLTELLETKSIAISAKAYSLVIADAAPFNDVRIVSDIRPVFSGKDEALEFTGSIIVHHLRIEVGGDGNDQYSALTTSDLQQLKKTVDRALEKDRRLREALRGGPLVALEAPSLAADKES